MRRINKIYLLGASLLAVQLWGAEPPLPQASTSPASTTSVPTSADDLKSLRERITLQEEQIRHLTQAVEEQRHVLDKAVANSAAAAARPPSNGSDNLTTIPVANRSDISVPIVPAVNVARPHFFGANRAGGQNLQAANPSPLSISIGSSTFTPLGFVDFTWVGRSTATGNGIGTNFAGIPYNTAPLAHISEGNFSTQNSRIGFRVDSKVLGAKVLGYFEGDFYGNQASNVFVSNNAATFRLRLYYVDLMKDKWEVLGGQSWSMFTPGRKGISPIPADLFYSQNMDLNYQAGLIWARQSQFRLLYHPTKDWVAGLSLENPQQYVGGSSGSSGASVAFPTALAATLLPQFNNNASAGTNSVTGGGNYGTPNLIPDIIFKTAYDAHVGKNDKILHVEAGALIREFKDTVPTAIPVGSPVKYNSKTATGVSGEINANFEIVKNVKLIANTFFGEGGGRYIFGLAPDVIVRADGSISPLHSYSTVDGMEITVAKNTLIDAYYGGVYIGKQLAIDTTGAKIGYGFAGSANVDNKSIQEGTFGITQTLWKNPNYGALSLITQYSYLTRNPWAVIGAAPKQAKTNIYFIDLRYTLP